jgi:hypothetical protein
MPLDPQFSVTLPKTVPIRFKSKLKLFRNDEYASLYIKKPFLESLQEMGLNENNEVIVYLIPVE